MVSPHYSKLVGIIGKLNDETHIGKIAPEEGKVINDISLDFADKPDVFFRGIKKKINLFQNFT